MLTQFRMLPRLAGPRSIPDVARQAIGYGGAQQHDPDSFDRDTRVRSREFSYEAAGVIASAQSRVSRQLAEVVGRVGFEPTTY
jgi:hypothetical protein